MDSGTPSLCGIHHVKLPVTDLPATRDWYCRALRFVVERDFIEDGRLMGVSLTHSGVGVRLALRHAPERVGELAGFDPIAWAVETRDDLYAWGAHLDRQGIRHTEITEASIGWIIVITDPDGREVKIYTLQRPG